MKALRLTLLALACSAPLIAGAQTWQWRDDAGRKVFSDTPPPASVPASRILRQPGQRPGAADAQAQAQATESPAVAAMAASAPKAAASRPSGKDQALEEARKQAEAVEAARKKAEEAKLAQAQSDNCRRARSGKADLTSGIRIARANAKGEREIMDDKARDLEIKHLDSVIARDCRAPGLAAQAAQ
ncbi:MAG: hypothetical protein JWP65_2471 [Ramlibacter sp.]|jgi:hypothetical protein|uniref:DUF4124 domain-containing protein n=1 Tax=Ramlibacter sp. TaxID=1917967 RepID=UPI0026269304|nr:DUF4124 domain-containing protein [Ramlibacter sp.]MDB5752050.1 hypothetical protein [Ramlibacter sp.]